MPFNPPIADWRGKTVWLVGASSGIGQALALRFHRAGYRLALVARRTSEVKTWASAC